MIGTFLLTCVVLLPSFLTVVVVPVNDPDVLDIVVLRLPGVDTFVDD